MRLLPVGWLIALLLCVGGCADVAPWQRARLAHPSMTERNESPGRAHMLAVQEGAEGGSIGAASGCGCN